MWLFLEPTDRLMFRDARPFEAGETFRARSEWPPSPTPVAGAIKTALLRLSGVNLQKYGEVTSERGYAGDLGSVIARLGSVNDYGQITIKGPLPGVTEGATGQPFFTLPADLTEVGSDRWEMVDLNSSGFRVRGAGVAFSPLLRFALDAAWEEADSENLWLTRDGLRAYLANDRIYRTEPSHAMPAERLAKIESHTGIMLQAEGRMVQPGMLYVAHFVRPLSWVEGPSYMRAGLLVWFHVTGTPGSADLVGKTLPLGGERRTVTVVAIRDDPLGGLKDLWTDSARARRFSKVLVYLVTPAVFERGWCPDGLQDGVLRVGHTTLRLVGAVVRKPRHIARWDLARGRPGLLVRAVPAGSVYLFHIEAGSFREAAAALHDTTFLQGCAGRFAPLSQIGFGWTMVGGRGDV